MAIAEGRNHFYRRDVISNIDFGSTPTLKWNFTANHIILVNDSKVNTILFSFNGEDLDGEIFPKDKSLTLNWKLASRIWLKSSSSTPDLEFRLWVWIE